MLLRRGLRSGSGQESRSDAELLGLVREGAIESFRTLYRRHYPAVFGYAAQCASCPADAHQLACRAFAQVLRATVDGTRAVLDRRHRGCLRIRLLAAVRTAAVQQSAQESGVHFTPRFRSWVGGGCQWPLNDDWSLVAAFTSLPESAQCLLWHAVVERDEPALVARIIGLDLDQLAPMTEQATDSLREAVADAYVRRIGEDCQGAAGQLEAAARPDGYPALHAIIGHLRSCSDCLAVYTELKELTTWLRRTLPPLLLGWWPANTYQATKASTAPPKREPRFLELALLGVDIESPLPEPPPDSLPEPVPAFCPKALPVGWGGRPKWRGSAVPGRRHLLLWAGGCGAVALAAVLVALVRGAPQGKPALPGTPRVRGDTYAVQDYSAPGSGDPRARSLGPSSWLRYDRVDFTGTPATRLSAGISAPVGAHAVLEVRLDSLAARPLAVFAAPADGSLGEVSVPIAATKGVHDVFLTASCPPSALPCTEVLWFAADRWAADL
ncbi:carbohydrate-binding protein [Wenjunlia tyrosinilytica]|uniref:Cellulose binding type IV domain-containing protein n=1 Tax=Wenjunlia tyrosinilytica TaxID=1544741 RepID=A0A917ZRR9_9ACTN|nr:carbohydrate-binding protein [Wenjunlia tyrosinilytica]GGO91639.1 hypothetical protein GCM10012280_39980 [Wenjunlia tyrosinilytica]